MATTPAEQKALLFLGAVALLGGGARLLRSGDDAPAPTGAEHAALARQVAAAESAAAAARDEKAGRGGKKSSKPREKRQKGDSTGTPTHDYPVDLDRATAAEIEALPGIGPGLAARIISDRELRGAFGSFAALDGVSGVGPTLIERLRPHVTFSGPPRPSTAVLPGGSPRGARPSGRVVGLVGGLP